MRVCVTGGAGFIGSHLTERLLREGHDVVVIDNLATGRADNLAGMAEQVRMEQDDLQEPNRLARLLQGCEVVFHQAALGSVPRSVADPAATHSANVTGTLHVLLAARQAGVRRVVAAGSSAVYGSNPVMPRSEDLKPEPLSPYAVSKLATEAYCRAFETVFGLETYVLRYFNIFGPRQDPTSQYAAVIPRFVTQMLAGRRPVIFGDGLQSRDFTYVSNAVDVNLAAMAAPPGTGGVYNVACGGQTTLQELVAAINQALGTDLEPEFAPPRPGDARHSCGDVTLARRVLGYNPAVGFAEGVARTVAWFRSQRERGALA